MPDTDEIQSIIVEFIRTSIQYQEKMEVPLDENLFTGGLIDSIGAMRLVSHMESRLDVKIPPGDLVPENFHTVEVMAQFLTGLQGSTE